MDEVHKRALTQCQSDIVNGLSFENEFLDKLEEQEILTPIILEKVQKAIFSRSEKVRELLTYLKRSGPDAYVKFLLCLDNSGHVHLADFIRDKENKIRNPSSHGDRQLHPSASAEPLCEHNLSNQSYNSHSLTNRSSSGGMMTSPSDESASNHGNTSLSEQDNNTTDDVRMENDADESNMSSQGSAASLEDTERSTNNMLESYKMTSTPRGIVLIINNESFRNGTPRTGAQQDGEMLNTLFEGLGFRVDMKKDQTGHEIKEELLRFSKLETLDQVDSLVVALMSHGNEEYIYGVDGEKQKIMSLVNFFNRDGCPAMKHKPKMFIVNACRGGMFDVITGSTNPRHNTIRPDSEQPPSNSDMIIAYSTFPGYVSLRDEQQGSIFIQDLVEVFREKATHEHVMDMLTQVNRKVASHPMIEEEGVEYKQTSATTTTLRYKWYLNPIPIQ